MRIKEYYIGIVEGNGKGWKKFLFRALLQAASFLYYIGISIRNFLYDRGIILKEEKVEIPVISVGNLTWGGTGKTSLVMFLLKTFPVPKKAVLTRGYGQDETDLLQRCLTRPEDKLFVGKNRLGILKNQAGNYDLALMDDAFQYRRVKKDLNILLINGNDPFGNGSLLPRGKLREPVSSIKRADLLVVMYKGLSVQLKNKIKKMNPNLDFFSGRYRVKGIFSLNQNDSSYTGSAGRRWACFSAIGYPQGFLSCLKDCNINPIEKFIYPDHHDLTYKEFIRIQDRCLDKGIDSLIITAKDIRRFRFLSKISIFVLEVELKIKEEEAFKQRLTRCIYC
jgi:tetraacyldisaccharide 4'-kinase